MAAKRIAKSAIDWTAFKERVPARQQDYFRAFKAKNEVFVNRVHQYPAELPKIDFAYYKSRLANPALVDQLQKGYEAVKVPYPTDKDKVLQDLDDQQKQAETQSKSFVAERQDEISDAKLMLGKIGKLPPAQEMTLEMYGYYFPQKALDPKRPSFWPHIPSLQPGHKDYHGI